MVTAYFSDIRRQILNSLDEAEVEILVAVYWFTNHELFDKLCDKLKNGVDVQLIIHNDYINNRDTGLDFQQFIDLGGKLFFSTMDNPNHNKFCIIDDEILLNGSYNWTYYAENKNNENMLVIKDERQSLLLFKNEFNRLKLELERVTLVGRLSKFEVDDFNELNARNYLANDIVYEARDTNRPEIITEAFQIAPANLKVQERAVDMNLATKKKLKYSIGTNVTGDKFLIGVKRGTRLPVYMTQEVQTSKDNQETSTATVFYGEDVIASKNRALAKLTLGGLPKLPKGLAKMKYIFSIDINGFLEITKISLDNGQKVSLPAPINLFNLIENEP